MVSNPKITKRRRINYDKRTSKRTNAYIQAFVEGKTIEYREFDGEWNIAHTPTWSSRLFYRIKPEPKYRPFKSREECWNEMMKHQPFGWLKSKKDGRFRCIGEVSWSDAFETVNVALSTSESLSRCVDSVFNEYTFADGTPFGIKEEQL